MKKRLAIISSHPIQYNAPLFKLLNSRGIVDIRVFYTWGEKGIKGKYDPGFAKIIEWDIPLLEGYDYSFVKNMAKQPGSHHFSGIINPTLNKEIQAWGADAVLIFGWSFRSHAQALKYFHKKIPVYFRGDSTLLDEETGILKTITKSVGLKWVYRHVDKAFYVGQANRAYFKKYGLKDRQLVFAPHAIDNDRFKEGSQSGQRQLLKIPDDAIVFVFTGKFEKKKNPGLLLEAFINLENAGCYLLMVGNGELEEQLKKRFRQAPLGNQSRIHFLDFQNQSAMPGIYRTGDVLVLPSQGPGETWGLSVNEAMASGLAVLVSNKCGCFPDLVQDGINGFVFESGNVNALAGKMKRMLSDKNKIIEMGKASQEIIREWSCTNICFAIEKEMSYI